MAPAYKANTIVNPHLAVRLRIPLYRDLLCQHDHSHSDCLSLNLFNAVVMILLSASKLASIWGKCILRRLLTPRILSGGVWASSRARANDISVRPSVATMSSTSPRSKACFASIFVVSRRIRLALPHPRHRGRKYA